MQAKDQLLDELKNVLKCSFYVNSTNFLLELTFLFYFDCSLSSPFYVAGDFNLPNCCNQRSSFDVFLRRLDLVQRFNFPTHIFDNILDFIVTSKSDSYLVDGLGRESFGFYSSLYCNFNFVSQNSSLIVLFPLLTLIYGNLFHSAFARQLR